MIPSIDRKEWRELVTGTYNTVIVSHSLKIRGNDICRKIKGGKTSIEEGINELYIYCLTHHELFKTDLYKIFKSI